MDQVAPVTGSYHGTNFDQLALDVMVDVEEV